MHNILIRRKSLLLVALLLAATAIRLPLLGLHFSHIDDIGVAATIIEAKNRSCSTAMLHRKFDAAVSGQDHTNPRLALLRKLGGGNRLAAYEGIWYHTYKWLAVPANWTYAPLQYGLTTPLVDAAHGYRENLIRGRLPSLLAALLAIGLMASLGSGHPAWRPAGWIAAGLMVFSLEHIIFSVHMSSYMAGILGAVLLLRSLPRTPGEPDDRIRSAILSAGGLLLLLYLNYQTFMLVPGWMAARWMAGTGGWRPNRRKFAFSAGVLLMYAVGFWPVFVLRIRPASTVLWNAGPNLEFLYAVPVGQGMLRTLAHAATFLARNGALAFSAMISPVPESSIGFVPVNALLMLLFLTGLIVLLLRRHDPFARALRVFSGITAVVWLTMVFSGRLPLSPTRHQLLWLPIFALIIGVGLTAPLTERWKHLKPAFRRACLTVLLVYPLMFALAFRDFVIPRLDLTNESDLAGILSSHSVDLIITDTPALSLMPSLSAYPKVLITRGDIPLSGSPSFRDPQTLAWILKRPGGSPGRPAQLPASDRRTLRLDGSYRLIWRRNTTTGAQVEMSSRTLNGGNMLDIAIWKREDPSNER